MVHCVTLLFVRQVFGIELPLSRHLKMENTGLKWSVNMAKGAVNELRKL